MAKAYHNMHIYNCTDYLSCFPGVSCSHPVTENNTHIISSIPHHEYLFEDEATFACDEGFEEEMGNTTRRCQADQSWSGDPLVCKRQLCYFLITESMS